MWYHIVVLPKSSGHATQGIVKPLMHCKEEVIAVNVQDDGLWLDERAVSSELELELLTVAVIHTKPDWVNPGIARSSRI